MAILRQPCSIAAKLGGIFLRRKVAAASPGFISHSPVTNVIRLGRTVGGAGFSKSGAARGRVAVFHPAIKLLGRQTADVGCQIGLTTNQFAEAHELIGAKAV